MFLIKNKVSHNSKPQVLITALLIIKSWMWVKFRWLNTASVFTFWDSFSSSSLTVSICDSDLRHSLLKMSFISGEHSDRTFRHNEMRSTSSSVIGFLGREDLPRCSTVTIISMASATNDYRGTGRAAVKKKSAKGKRHKWVLVKWKHKSLHFASFCLELLKRSAEPLWLVWWPKKLPHRSLHPSKSLLVEA